MRQLRYFSHSPFCRKIRLVLGEKKLPFEAMQQRPWESGVPLAALPALTEADGMVFTDSRAMAEYLDESHVAPPLMPADPKARAGVRKWINHIDECIWQDITSVVLQERVFRRYSGDADRQPDLPALKLALQALRDELHAIEDALVRHGWLGPSLSLADLTAAAHLSVLDYFGDVPWQQFPGARDWYASIKSRPSFRPLLADQLPGFPPAAHYTDLDF
jgi:glutathione S-transferase